MIKHRTSLKLWKGKKKRKTLKKRKTKYKRQKGGFPNRNEFADIGRETANSAIISMNNIAPGFV